MLTEKQSNESIDLKRDAWIEVDLEAVRHNVDLVKSWVSCPIMGVVKGDAYGHGAIAVGRHLLNKCGLDWLGVATATEALELRSEFNSSSSSKRVLVLSPSPTSVLRELIENKIDLTVTMKEQLSDIAGAASKTGQKAHIHLKVDSGMHRLGIQLEDLTDVLEIVLSEKSLHLESIYSHLAKAGDLATTQFQNNNFASCLVEIKDKLPKGVFFHLANSEAARRFPFSHHDMVRIGLYLYGLEPNTQSTDLKPALSLKAKINNIMKVRQAEGVGYNWTWSSDKPARLASVPIGYADGISRKLSNKMAGYIHGKKIMQAGIISMDQMLFDITDIPKANLGDVITIIGDESPELSLANLSNLADTITYESACALALRLPRIYK